MNQKEEANDLSILKTLKLLFFITAANSNKQNHSVLLEEVYNNYVAMPYGHVESDVYTYLRLNNGKLTCFIIDNKKTLRIPNRNIFEVSSKISDVIKIEIDKSLDFLQTHYPTLILLSPFDLVNLSHSWYSWKHYYNFIAQQSNTRSAHIPPSDIKAEEKIYRLQKI